MKRYTSFLPELVRYADYYDCEIKDALLAELRYRGNVLTLPQIGDMRVNGYRLLGSYGKAIQKLRQLGYDIETILEQKNKHTLARYVLRNPNHNHENRNTNAKTK